MTGTIIRGDYNKESIEESIQKINIKEEVDAFIKMSSEEIKKELIKKGSKIVKEERLQDEAFMLRNIDKWKAAFDLYGIHLCICKDIGSDINNEFRDEIVNSKDILLDLLVKFHAHACHIATEILCLMENGYADAAHSRWRALHETNVLAQFIKKNGQECAERYQAHQLVDLYNLMIMCKNHSGQINQSPPTQEQFDECKKNYDEAVSKYGKEFTKQYGWASPYITTSGKIGFKTLVKNIGFEHWEFYYSKSSNAVHVTPYGMNNKLALSENFQQVLVVGQSNQGMIEPGHAASVSLTHITALLLQYRETLDHIIIMKIISEIEHEIGDKFLAVHTQS
ncbi:DUF5677 domain-containing protein [Legionella septentrionalis]|uniref:Uncharacterized protein n=1 Tax=Legionella septentrionalis TaxID=2498109 RepID=A0A433JG75_9GAMM|nr:DUF5677 domain-containing protein [Legionella septentrionalis]RUQ78840.1 hypothetical protein EKM59_11675 [Legionella septentrionalis]